MKDKIQKFIENKNLIYILFVCIMAGVAVYVALQSEASSKAFVEETEVIVETEVEIENSSEILVTEIETEIIAAAFEDTQVLAEEIGLLSSIEIEAGTKEITISDFFENQEEGFLDSVILETEITEEMLLCYGEEYPVTFTVGDNQYSSKICVVDHTPPVFEKCDNINAILGQTVAYKSYVKVSDNSNSYTIAVDSSSANLKKEGQYEIRYTATDEAGNATSQTSILTVIQIIYNEELVAPAIDKIIGEVTNGQMSSYEKAYALFEWVRANVTYTGNEYSTDNVWTGAYEGLVNRKGDCFVFYATYASLLTRAGIENKVVTRVGGTSPHYWNLVCIEDGWYHCDTSPRNKKFPYICFMQTDEQVAAYSTWNTDKPNYYVFDANSYPERSTKKIFGE